MNSAATRIERAWPWVVLALAAAFAAWAVALLLSAQRQTAELARNAALVARLSALEDAIRDLESAAALARPGADGLPAWWEARVRSCHDAFAGVRVPGPELDALREPLQNAEKLVTRMETSFRILSAQSSGAPRDAALREFHMDAFRATDDIRVAAKGRREHVNAVSEALLWKWRQITSLVFLAGILAAATALLLRRTAGARAEKVVTEKALRESEERLLQAQKMEAVGRLAGGIAHDFNNLLTVIIGIGTLLRDRFAVGDPLRHDAEEILRAAERAASLTRQLLLFSRRQVAQPVVLELNSVVRDLERMLRRTLGEDVALETRLASDLGRVRCDRGQMEQVVINLAVNARDAMPGGGSLVISTANLPAGGPEGTPSAPAVSLSVSDTGQGISDEVRAHLFEPFFTTKDPGKGTGLGLATVYGIVRQAGGTIVVDSAPGRGATFTVYLPATDDPLPQPAGEVRPRSAIRSTILVVEDEDGVRGLARSLLSNAGYTVLEAPDGPSALDLAERFPGVIHLLLTDVVMPGMSGRELAEKLRQKRGRLQVLYMSGYTEDESLRRGVSIQEADFLEKPFTPASLLNRVRAAIDRAIMATRE